MRFDRRQHTWAALTIAEVNSLFAGCSACWWLSGGWAIDHWAGVVTRQHDDIDVSTLRPCLAALIGALPEHLRPYAAIDGHLLPLAERVDHPDLHNIWIRNERLEQFVLQMNLEDGDESGWRYRRDARVTLPWDMAVRLVRSTPTGTPATQLLWKAKSPRPQDESDLNAMQGVLQPAERRWLREAIRTAHPESPWLNDPRLSPSGEVADSGSNE